MSGAEMADARKMRDGAPRRKVNGDVGHSHSVLRTDDTVFEAGQCWRQIGPKTVHESSDSERRAQQGCWASHNPSP